MQLAKSARTVPLPEREGEEEGDGQRPSVNRLRHFTKSVRASEWIRLSADRAAGPAITVLLSVAAMAQALKVWRWRPGDPVDLSGDTPWLLAAVKGMLAHGLYDPNVELGAPFQQDPSWFPHADQLHLFLVVKVIGLFSGNPFTVSAIYFFLGFPLAALSMYWLARQRHVRRLGSVVAGVLFSILPGHQTMFPHLMLASYWVVPLGMWLVFRAALGEPIFRLQVNWRNRAQRDMALRMNLTTAACVVCIGIGGIYYSAFTLLLLAVALLVRLVATRNLRSIARASMLLVTIGTVSLAAVLSVVAGQDKRTLVTTSNQRGFWESEKYAGKLMDLILPWIHHRVGVMQYLTVAYNSRTTPTFEELALGMIALAGVVALILIMLSSLILTRIKPVDPELGMLGILTLVAVSLFSVGGLGSFVALFVTSQIRTWSRLFIFIGLFGLLAVGHWVTVISRRSRTLGLLSAIALLLIGVVDQTNPAVAPHYQDLHNRIADLTTFTREIQTRVGPGCSVFQLPIVAFPEHPGVHDMDAYEHFEPYLGSSSLRWSYGAFNGTSLADWQLALPQTSPAVLVNDIVAVGFCAVELDRKGFADRGAGLEKKLTSLLGPPIATTHDKTLLAWDLRPARAALSAHIGAKKVTSVGDLVLHPLLVYTDHGTYDVERENQTPYQWTGPSPEIDVHNFGRTIINHVQLAFSLAAPDSGFRHFSVHLPDGGTQEVEVQNGIAQEVHLVLNAAPGRNAVIITTTGPRRTAINFTSTTAVEKLIVFGKLIDVRAQVVDPTIHIAVIQQRVD